MVNPPYNAASFPADYLAYIQPMTSDRQFPMTHLFSEPKDPGMALGRQGDENFQESVLIGYRTDQLFPILKYSSKQAYAPRVWQYCIVSGAEWNVCMEFDTFAQMIAYFEMEKPPIEPPSPPQRKGKKPRRT